LNAPYASTWIFDFISSHSFPFWSEQDSNIFVSESDAGVSHKVVLDAGRQIYMVCIEGALKLGAPDGEITLAARDAVEIVAGKKALHLDLTAGEGGSHFMLMEMTSNPSIGGW
jgi:hypothetical protein